MVRGYGVMSLELGPSSLPWLYYHDNKRILWRKHEKKDSQQSDLRELVQFAVKPQPQDNYYLAPARKHDTTPLVSENAPT